MKFWSINVALMTLFACEALADHELRQGDIRQGQRLYMEYCASCHGADLKGQENWRSTKADDTLPAPPHDETGHTWHHDSKFLFSYTKLGGAEVTDRLGIQNFKSGMPGFSNLLNDKEIWNILAFIYSRWPKRIQEIQDSRNPAH